MNNLYRPRQTGKFAVSSESLLALLLLVAFVQIALCLSAGFALVPPITRIPSVGEVTSLETNTLLINDPRAASSEKSSGFQSVTTHG